MTNVVALKSGGAIAPIIPKTIEEVFRLATGISKSGLAPHDMDTPEQVMVAILTGLEIGLPPMFSIQKIAVINGRPTLWGDAVPALLWSRGIKLTETISGDGDDRTARCEVTRSNGEKIARSFSVRDAKKAGLWGKKGPWSQYPDRMLQMRARGYACRDGAADALSGLYLTEEIQENRMRDVTPDVPARPALELPSDDEMSWPSQEHDPIDEDTLVDADGFITKLSEDIELCSSIEELNEIADANADMIERLPKSQKLQAAKILAEAAE